MTMISFPDFCRKNNLSTTKGYAKAKKKPFPKCFFKDPLNPNRGKVYAEKELTAWLKSFEPAHVFGTWLPIDKNTPKDRPVLLNVKGYPWAVMGQFNEHAQAWSYSTLHASTMKETGDADVWWENELDKAPIAWHPIPEV
jgi:hypothetical protein